MLIKKCITELKARGMSFNEDYQWFEKTIGSKPMDVDVCVYADHASCNAMRGEENLGDCPIWHLDVNFGRNEEKKWSHLYFQDVLNLLDGKTGKLLPDWYKEEPQQKQADAILERLTKDGFLATINWHADSKKFVVSVPGSSYHRGEGDTLLEALEKLESAMRDDMQKISDFLASHGWVKQEDVSCHWIKYLHGPYGNTLTLSLTRDGIHWVCECHALDSKVDMMCGNSVNEVLDILCDRMRNNASNIMLYLTEKVSI